MNVQVKSLELFSRAGCMRVRWSYRQQHFSNSNRHCFTGRDRHFRVPACLSVVFIARTTLTASSPKGVRFCVERCVCVCFFLVVPCKDYFITGRLGRVDTQTKRELSRLCWTNPFPRWSDGSRAILTVLVVQSDFASISRGKCAIVKGLLLERNKKRRFYERRFVQ